VNREWSGTIADAHVAWHPDGSVVLEWDGDADVCLISRDLLQDYIEQLSVLRVARNAAPSGPSEESAPEMAEKVNENG
jgi:hypothetical protein